MESNCQYPMQERERYSLYDLCGLSSRAIETIEEMLQASGARKVGKGALGNVVTAFSSRKMAGTVHLESHTCEQVFAYELEMDPSVLMYFTQIPCRGVERVRADGKRHVSSATLDFLVFRTDGVQLVECKQVEWLRNQSCSEGDWRFEAEKWTHGPYAAWADGVGIQFQVWAAPDDVGIYHQNLGAAYAALNRPPCAGTDSLCAAAIGQIKRHPRSIAELSQLVTGFGISDALLMLARRQAFGPWRSLSADREDQFILFSEPVQAEVMDDARLELRAKVRASIGEINDPLLSASSIDIEFAKERLLRARSIMSGAEPATRRMKALVRLIGKIDHASAADLSACLTRYARSGNRVRRLAEANIQLIDRMIKEVWNKGRVVRPIDLEMIYREECKAAGIAEDGISTLRLERRKTDPLRHALATRGMRGYQAVRPHSDPRFRSLSALAYGQIMHVDSTSVDMRVLQWIEGEKKVVTLRAIFYIAIDSATAMPLGIALMFGSPRSEALAILFRDVVRRNGFLPSMIHLDRGPENRSLWLQEFCETSSVRYSPTAGSAWNSLAESTLKMVNHQVSQRLVGSTLSDQRARAADGRFKSRQTARLDFISLYREIEHYVFENLAVRTVKGDGSPVEKRDALIERGASVGLPVAFDDEFMIRTSVRVKKAPVFSRRGALRLEEGTYCSEELLEMRRRLGKIDHMRLDCEDAKVLYIKTSAGCWIKAFHQRFQSLIDEDSRIERTFDLCWDSIEGPVIRRERLADAMRHRLKLETVNRNAASAQPGPPAGETPASENGGGVTKNGAGEHLPPSSDTDPFEEVEV